MAFRCILVEYTRNMIAEDELLRCTGFDWDDANVLKIWQKHQVSAMECEEVFFNLPLVAGHDEKHSHDERRYYVLGQSDGGRRLFVVVTIREGLLRVISARDMNARNERFTNQYERQKEKGHPVNGEVGTWLAPSGSQICSPFACPYSRLQ